MNRLEGKVAVITGANSGVGAAMAELFASEGAKVVISARRVSSLETVALKIREAGGDVLVVPTDISKVSDVDNLVVKTIETFGKLDILVNNAGILDKNFLSIANFETEDLNQVIDINTKGTMYCTRKALSVMKDGSSIVNIASVAGIFGTAGACYVASKAAIIGITKHTALVSAKAEIRCNVICPGGIVTPMTAALDMENIDMSVMSAVAIHNDTTLAQCMPIDVANVALFLASDEAKSITGQVLACDFGLTL